MEDAINQTKVSQQCSPPHDRLYRLLTDVSPIKSEMATFNYDLPIKSNQAMELIQLAFPLTKRSTHSFRTAASQPPAYNIPEQ